MKYLHLLLALILINSCQSKKAQIITNSINPIIGDISYVEKFGEQPTEQSDENLRIKTHLAYVEHILRNKNTDHLSKSDVANRNILLDNLHAYHEAGIFPKNHDYKNERRPCFIDKDENICAVGYLVEQSLGLDAAKKINEEFKYATIDEMKSELLNQWVANSGFTKNEVAMIQPTYSNPKPYNYVGKDYGLPSAILGVANIGFSTASLVNWNNPEYKKKYAKLGLLSGAMTLGFNSLYSVATFRTAKTTYQKKVSNLNFVSGLASIGINGLRLRKLKRANKNKKISWNLNLVPGLFQEPVYGLALTKKL